MAYNPSQQLPISKPFGSTGKFPVVGKYEFYTNGASGVYAYRVFANVAEIGTYIPSEFRRLGDTFLVNSGGTLSGDGGTITGGTNSEYWYKDDLTTPVLKGSGSGITVIIDATSTPYTKSSLNAEYPDALKGDIVIQDDANQIYIKKDNSPTGNWSTFPSVQLT